MDGRKKKLQSELNNRFPERFPDTEAESILLGQRKLILDIQSTLYPDMPGLKDRIKELEKTLIDKLRPPRLSGENNDVDAIRNGYWSSLGAMQLEGILVTKETSAIEFLQLIKSWNEKHKPKNTHA